jgi:hypothetical protein
LVQIRSDGFERGAKVVQVADVLVNEAEFEHYRGIQLFELHKHGIGVHVGFISLTIEGIQTNHREQYSKEEELDSMSRVS